LWFWVYNWFSKHQGPPVFFSQSGFLLPLFLLWPDGGGPGWTQTNGCGKNQHHTTFLFFFFIAGFARSLFPEVFGRGNSRKFPPPPPVIFPVPSTFLWEFLGARNFLLLPWFPKGAFFPSFFLTKEFSCRARFFTTLFLGETLRPAHGG